ncbi:hypothetical protein A0J61_09756 [Choanephora cucurbitarum]|uniref:Uncharacterized protein n=1 Tax=Choanephora cucurbitarum TaxID=101091 RepID=A0A1C7N0K0_9FUNG|nr:hypothetical protein A0J61_09756 [Choanephora cucurbitarum]
MHARNPQLTFDQIKERKERGISVFIPAIKSALIQEAKYNHSFSKAEILYGYLTEAVVHRTDPERHRGDINCLRRAIGVMTRYAPNPDKALFYAYHFFAEFGPPFRTPSSEMIVLTNLLFAYSLAGTEEAMRNAVDIIRLAIEIGVFRIDPKGYDDVLAEREQFKHPLDVFETICQRPLQHQRLMFNADKSDLIPVHR